MGISHFFGSFILASHPAVLVDARRFDRRIKFDSLYIDGNSIVHSNIDPEDGTKAPATCKDLKLRILGQLDDIMRKVNPTRMVFIAMDGDAPLGKCSRSPSPPSSQVFGDSTTLGKDSWRLIKPASGLLDYLESSMVDYLTNLRAGVQVELSSSRVRGEGKAKIMKRLKASSCSSICIYSRDADSVVLALAKSSSTRRVWILRDNPPSQTSKRSCKFINIELLKQELCSDMRSVGLSDQKLMKDFAVLTFLMGNDYVPKLAGLPDIQNGGLNALLAAYKGTNCLGSYLLTEDGKVNTARLSALLTTFQTKQLPSLSVVSNKEAASNYVQGLERLASYYFSNHEGTRCIYQKFGVPKVSDFINFDLGKASSTFTPSRKACGYSYSCKAVPQGNAFQCLLEV